MLDFETGGSSGPGINITPQGKPITEKLAQTDLASLLRLVNITFDAIAIHDFSGRIIHANDRACNMLGLTLTEMMALNAGEMPPFDKTSRYWEKLIPGHPLSLESSLERSDGVASTIEIRLGLVSFEGENLIVTRIMDRGDLKWEGDKKRSQERLEVRIKEKNNELEKIKDALHSAVEGRKSLESAFREQQDKLKKYLYIAGTIMLVVNADQTVELINRKGIEVLKCSESRIIGKNWFDCFLHDREKDILKQGFMAAMADQIRDYEYSENFVVTKDGGTRLIAWNNILLKDSRGMNIAMMCSGTDITDYRQSQENLVEKNRQLENANHALKLMLDHRDVEKKAIEESIVSQLKRTVTPYLERLESCALDVTGKTCMEIVRKAIDDFSLTFSRSLSSRYIDLTPSEIQVCELIRQGKSSKEIAGVMNISPSTASFHRNNIRKKLGILKKKTNLRTYLNSFSN
jgi:PAS domain S-box-containing protein